MLDRVTLTGADTTTDIEHMGRLSEAYPFVEWGILVSESSAGSPRFPSFEWIVELYRFRENNPINLSVHVCGEWVRDICAGNWSPFMCHIGPLANLADRIQLNFHAYTHLITPNFVPESSRRCKENGWELIFQVDGVNDHLVFEARAEGLPAVPLFDKSGGAGIVPDKWPMAIKGVYCGYAGGLGPSNVLKELVSIEYDSGLDCPARYWIDMETKVRSRSGLDFDLDLCEEVLASVELNAWHE